MKKVVMSIFSTFLVLMLNTAYSAKLCGQHSSASDWDSGVFSVIDQSGVTVATTNLIKKGEYGCTKDIPDGVYIIRFNGALGGSSLIADSNIYGCVTSPYSFNGKEIINVVYHQGQYPFNGNEFCFPDDDCPI